MLDDEFEIVMQVTEKESGAVKSFKVIFEEIDNDKPSNKK
tara:strand:- start:19685 stop:19804 length:120 start_codon:yes stop_codon:yes gene_type:complete